MSYESDTSWSACTTGRDPPQSPVAHDMHKRSLMAALPNRVGVAAPSACLVLSARPREVLGGGSACVTALRAMGAEVEEFADAVAAHEDQCN